MSDNACLANYKPIQLRMRRGYAMYIELIHMNMANMKNQLKKTEDVAKDPQRERLFIGYLVVVQPAH